MFGDVADVSCSTGYDLVGNASLACKDSGWIGTSECIVQGMILLNNQELIFIFRNYVHSITAYAC